MTTNHEFVHARVDERIGFIVIDRAPVNAYNWQTHREIYQTLLELQDEPELRCVVLSAAGVEDGRPFGAGSDVKEFVALDPQTSLQRARSMRTYFAAMSSFPFPVVAAVENVILGSGFAWSARADIRVMSTTTSLGMPEIKVGALGGGMELTRLVGPGKAREMYYTGRRIEAAEAFRLGYAEHLVEPGQALAKATSIAQEITRNSPFALRLAKEQMNFAENSLNRDEAYKYETELTALYRSMPDASEGAEAFVQKRQPGFDSARAEAQ